LQQGDHNASRFIDLMNAIDDAVLEHVPSHMRESYARLVRRNNDNTYKQHRSHFYCKVTEETSVKKSEGEHMHNQILSDVGDRTSADFKGRKFALTFHLPRIITFAPYDDEKEYEITRLEIQVQSVVILMKLSEPSQELIEARKNKKLEQKRRSKLQDALRRARDAELARYQEEARLKAEERARKMKEKYKRIYQQRKEERIQRAKAAANI